MFYADVLEKVKKASSLDLLSISKTDLLTREMWETYCGAQYSSKNNTQWAICDECKASKKLNSKNFYFRSARGKFGTLCIKCSRANDKKRKIKARLVTLHKKNETDELDDILFGGES